MDWTGPPVQRLVVNTHSPKPPPIYPKKLHQQAQRDFFGGHTYERTDREGWFHCAWTEAHKDLGDVTQRTAGELSAVSGAVTGSGH